jgi:hypothetical protein
MANNTSGFPSQIAADPEGTVRLIGALSSRNAEALRTSLNQQLTAASEGMQKWAQDFTQNISVAQTAMVGFQGAAGQAFNSLSQGMSKHIAHTALYSQSVSDAMQKALKSTLTAITAEAMVRAIYNAGLGFYFLAVQAYDQAAQAFQAAAVFSSVAGVATTVGEAVAGPSGSPASGSEGSKSASKRSTPAPASAASASSSPSGGNLTVMVVGESQAATWLTQVINTGVEQHDLRLVASHTKRSAPAGR